MSSLPTIRCPKCGNQSQNAEICDVCGALIARIQQREREMDSMMQESSFGKDYGRNAKIGGASDTGPFMKLVILLIVAAAGYFLYTGIINPSSGGSAYVDSLTADEFNRRVIRAPKSSTWVVDFWAPWCGPCKQFAPDFAEAAGKLGTRANFAKVNIDEAKAVAERYSVTAIPTVILFRNGRIVDQITGGMDGNDLAKWVENRLPASAQ